MIPTPPQILILNAYKQTLDAVDFADATGIAGVTVRHRRNRSSVAVELPCVAIVLDADEPEDDDLDLNSWETRRRATISLIIDSDLADEDSGDDPTGLGDLVLMQAASLRALKTPGSPISLLVDGISSREIVPSEESQSDRGRLVCTTFVLYRVRVDDETELLAEGVNA